MSESDIKEVTCRSCGRKVPAGIFCIKCGNKIATESRDGVTNEEPRPPIQASDAVSAYGIKVSSQNTSRLATFNVSINSSSTCQDDEISAVAAQLLSIGDQAQHQRVQQSSSLGGVADVPHVDNSSGRSGAQPTTHGGAPRTPDREIDGNGWFEVWILCIASCIRKLSISYRVKRSTKNPQMTSLILWSRCGPDRPFYLWGFICKAVAIRTVTHGKTKGSEK